MDFKIVYYIKSDIFNIVFTIDKLVFVVNMEKLYLIILRELEDFSRKHVRVNKIIICRKNEQGEFVRYQAFNFEV